jgi:hypothetical protein
VDLTAPIATLAGALVGAGSMFWTDRLRWRRGRAADRSAALSGAYLGFLTALQQARETYWSLARGYLPEGKTLDEAAREALTRAEVFAKGEHLLVIAPQHVIDAVNAAVDQLRDIRDVVRSGASAESPEYRQADAEYEELAQSLRHTIRLEVGAPTLPKTPLPPPSVSGPTSDDWL